MKLFVWAAVCMVALALAPVSLPRAVAAASDTAQIQALYRQFAADFRAKNVNAIMSLYVQGNSLFVFDLNPPREHVGSANYRNDWQQTFAYIRGTPSFTVTNLSVTIGGDVAYTHSIQKVRAAATKGPPFNADVRVTDVLRKINGKWLIVQEHVSVPVDMNGKAVWFSR